MKPKHHKILSTVHLMEQRNAIIDSFCDISFSRNEILEK